MIDDTPHNPPYEGLELIAGEDNKEDAKADLERLLKQMPTPRYANVIKMLLIEDWEPNNLADKMGITTANLYNIKHRAMVQLTRIALNDIKEYGK